MAHLGCRALPPQSLNFPIPVDLVVLQYSQLCLLALVLDLLGRGVHLLLALLGSASQAQYQMEGGFLLDVVIRECAAIFELFAGEDQALLIRGDAFFIYILKLG